MEYGFIYRFLEGNKSSRNEYITHDDCEMFRILGWHNRDKESRNLDKRLISVHNPGEWFESGVDSWFKEDNEMVHYNFLFAGAGDTRKQRALFATDEVRHLIIPYIMNGLTMDDVNRLINGKHICSGLRFTTYESLWLTGSRRINFDIDRCIVIKDIEHTIKYKAKLVDAPRGYVSDDLHDVEKDMEITDGAGMFLPGTFKHRAFTARAPWFKGLMVEHDFMAVAIRTGNHILIDAWGQEHDIVAEGINCIWTTSQLKLWKAYKSWDHYKRYFKQYKQWFCEALVPEKKHELTLSYQPLQSLNVSYEQTERLIKQSLINIWDDSGRRELSNGGEVTNYKRTIEKLGYDKMPVFNELTTRMLNTPFGIERVRLYLLNRINHLRCGEIELQGYEPFVSPDWNYVCNVLFGDNAPTVPTNYVSCPYFNYGKRCDIIRYPHLYTGAHCIRTNTYVEGLNAPVVYADHDGITALLCEADYDGDHLQMFLDKELIDIVSSEANQMPPIYYECASGKKHPVNFDFSEHGIFTELKNSYAGKANVGVPSNWATRIFNSDLDWEQKMKYIPLLAHCVQGRIDYPKTGESYDIPSEMIKDIKSNYMLPSYMMFKKFNEDKDRKDRKNKGIMSKIRIDVCGVGNYTPTAEQTKEILELYKLNRKNIKDFLNYDLPKTREQAKYIMDYISVLCDKLEKDLNLADWYIPGTDNMFRLNLPGNKKNQSANDYSEFITECADKHKHAFYQERINAMTMVNPDPDIQRETKEEFFKRYPNCNIKRELFVRAIRDKSCVGFVLYLWPKEFLEWAKTLKAIEGISMKARKSKGNSHGGKLGGKNSHGAAKQKCFIIFEDTGEVYLFESIENAVAFVGNNRRGILKARQDNRSFKCKNHDNRKAKLVIPNDN